MQKDMVKVLIHKVTI